MFRIMFDKTHGRVTQFPHQCTEHRRRHFTYLYLYLLYYFPIYQRNKFLEPESKYIELDIKSFCGVSIIILINFQLPSNGAYWPCKCVILFVSSFLDQVYK